MTAYDTRKQIELIKITRHTETSWNRKKLLWGKNIFMGIFCVLLPKSWFCFRKTYLTADVSGDVLLFLLERNKKENVFVCRLSRAATRHIHKGGSAQLRHIYNWKGICTIEQWEVNKEIFRLPTIVYNNYKFQSLRTANVSLPPSISCWYIQLICCFQLLPTIHR